jgi:1-phosphofructokinase family hexose kinase
MRKIVCAIAPNPALDLGGTVEKLLPNEKSYVHNETQSPGGNAINAARILSRLNTPVIATGFLGGSIGQEVEHLLKLEEVPCQFIKIKDSTRINVTVSNQSSHLQTRLSFRGPQIRGHEKSKLFNLIKNTPNIGILVIGGSLPRGFAASDVKRLIKIAEKQSIPTVVDTPGKILRQIISARPLLIKPNLEEFHELTETHASTVGAVLRQARKLLDQVPFICVSSVENGTLMVTRNGTYFGRIPLIKVRSTVGAGDSMVGAIISQLIHGNSDPEELLHWGLGAAAATLSQQGTNLGTKKQICQLLKSTRVLSIK